MRVHEGGQSPNTEWGAVQVLTGMELEVLRKVRSIPDVGALAPMDKRTELRSHKPREIIRPLLPGYVLIYWNRDPATYYRVRTTPGVIRFLGDGQPQSIPEEQMRVLLALARHCEGGRPAPAICRDGRTAISGGPLYGLHPKITRVNRRAGRATLAVQIGNETQTVTVAVDIKPDGGGG